MKVRLLTDFNPLEGISYPKGTEVTIIDSPCCCGTDGYSYLADFGDRKLFINTNNVEVIDYTPTVDIQQKKYELAKEIYILVLQSSSSSEAAEYAVKAADIFTKKFFDIKL